MYLQLRKWLQYAIIVSFRYAGTTPQNRPRVQKKEELLTPSDSRCGSVETCCNAVPSFHGRLRERKRGFLALRVVKYGKFDPEEH